MLESENSQVCDAVIRELSKGSDAKSTIAATLGVIGKALDWKIGICWIVASDNKALYPFCIWKVEAFEAKEILDATLRLRFGPGIGLPGRVWKSAQPAWISDVIRDSNFPRAQIAAKDGLHGGMGLPLFGAKNEVLGVIEFFSERELSSDEHLLPSTISKLGELIGQYVLRIRSKRASAPLKSTLKQDDRLLKLVTDAMPSLISYIDSEEKCRFANGAYERWFGLDRSQILGQPMKKVFGESLYISIRPYVQRALLGYPVHFETHGHFSNMGDRHLEFTCVPDFSELQEIRGFFVLVNDISERKKLETVLKDSLRKKDEFLMLASHELRTPLTPLTLQVQFLEEKLEQDDPILTDKGFIRKFVDAIRREVDRLRKLVEDMLDSARVLRENLPIEKEEVDLSRLVRNVLEENGTQLRSAECQVTVVGEKVLLAKLDPYWIEQAIRHLLSNVMKFCAGSPFEVSVTKTNGTAVVFFRDHGPGIAKADLERIFHRFERATAPNHSGGLGIGLFMSRQIVEAHGGRIHAESELGKGSIFIVELPLA